MNRTYRSIWNEALGAWVAASEHDSARGKPNKSAVTKAVATAVFAAGALASNVAHAQYYSAGGGATTSSNSVAIGPSSTVSSNNSTAIGAGATS
ncbi:ESPR domain-containing protein, partial [Burkholderia cenocepacia]